MPYVNGQFQPAMPGTINALATGGAAPVNSGGDNTVSPQDAMISDATGMPPGSGGGLVPYNHHTGQPYGTRFGAPTNALAGIPKAPAPGKPTYATSTVPMFPDYAQFAMKRDNVDPSTVTDQQLLGYSKEYAENMLPQALMAAGHKVDAEYLKTLPHNFQYATSQALPQLRDIINKNIPPPDAATAATTPNEGVDWLKQLAAKATETGGQALASTVRSLSDPRILFGPMGPPLAALVDKVSPEAHDFFNKIDQPRTAAVNKLSSIGAKTGQAIAGSESPAFQTKENQPFFNEDQPWVTPDGALNPKKFNANALNLPNVVGKGEDVLLPLLALAATRNPTTAAAAFGAQASEASHQAEIDRLGKLTPDQWKQVPAYVHKIQEGMSPDDAKAQTTEESAKTQQMIGAASGTLSGLAGGLPWFRPMSGTLFTRALKNFAVQAPSFAALSGGAQAAANIGRTATTGEAVPVGQGVAEAAASGGLQGALFSILGARAPEPGARPGGPPPSAGEGPGPAGAPAGASGGPVDVPGAVAQAFEEHPPQAFKTPEEAAQHYGDASTVFKGVLEGDGVPPDQIAAQIPAFNEAWSRATGHEVPGGAAAGSPAGAGEGVPTPGTPEEEAAVRAAVTSPQEELDLGTQPGEVRGATAADNVPVGLRTRIEGDLKDALGRDPTPEEVVEHSKDVLDATLSDPKIDQTIPRNALEEAVGRLIEVKNELPEPEEVNALARKIEKEPQENVLAKKAEAAPEESGAADEQPRLMKQGDENVLSNKVVDLNEVKKQKQEEAGTKKFYNELMGSVADRVKKLQEEIANTPYKFKEGDVVKLSQTGKRVVIQHKTLLADRREGATFKERTENAKNKPKIPGYRVFEDGGPDKGGAAYDVAEWGIEPHKGLRELNPRSLEQGEGEELPREELKASPEQRKELQPVEDFYKQFSNVHDLLQGLVSKLKNPMLKGLVQRILNNPYISEQLKREGFRVKNPEDTAKSPEGEDIGNFLHQKKEGGKLYGRGRAHWGAWEPRHGVTVAGAGWHPNGPLDNGLHPVTVMHEVVHAAIARILDAIEKGRIVDPDLVDAYHELEGIRKALKEKLDISSQAKDTKGSFNYAMKDVHELLSVSLTDPRVQGILKSIKLGAVNAWKKMLGIYNKLLGGAPEDMNTLDRVIELSNKFLDYQPKGYKSPEEISPKLSRQSDEVEKNTPERVMDAMSVKPKPAVSAAETKTSIAQNAPPTTAEGLETKVFDKLKPLTHTNERLAANGQTVGPNENMDSGARVYQNLAGRASNIVQQKFITPTLGKLAEMAKAAGKPVDEFVTHLAAYYMGRRSLEVNERGELESARLKKDAEIKRDAIKGQWINGELTDGKYTEALKKVVNAPGARVSNRSPLYKSGISDQTAHAVISIAKKNGISKGVIDQFEPIRKQILEEIDKNNKASNKFSSADEARKSGLGSKWYMPLSGFGEAREDAEGTGIGAFTREYHAAGGRDTIAANPIVNLLQQLQRSARDVPENALTKTVYNFARKFGKSAGIKIRTLDVEKAIRDAHASGKGLDDIARIFKNENSIVHNAGNFRYSMEFPPDSPVLKALKGINDTPELSTAERVLGTVSNIIARGATTLNPKFLLWNAFWRDMGYVGSQVGADLGPTALAQYMGRYWLQGGPLRGRPTYFSGLHPRNALEREAFAATGKSSFAKSLSEIAQYGGDLSFEHELNKTKNLENLYDALKKAEQGGSARDKLDAVVKVLDQIGTSDIMTARVAAYETYKDVAMKKLGKDATPEQVEQVKKDGALWSRRILDYQQRSDMSRVLNIAFPFSRVVLNQTDRLFQTFKRPDGSFDLKRVAKFAGIGMMAGAAYYALLRQAHPDIKKEKNSTLAQNFVIPVDGQVVKIPMAYGLTRLMLVPGMMVARAAFGDSSKEDAVNEIRNAVMEGVLPFKPPEPKRNESLWDELADLGTSVTPGAIRPFVELGRNENIFSGPITPSDEYTKGPHAEAGRYATPEFWKDAAKILHTITGGAIDAYPESLEYLTQAYGTGIGNGFLRVAAMEDRSGKGQETNLQQLPFVPSVTSRDAEFYTADQLRDRQQDLEAKGKPLPKNESDKEAGVTYLSEQETEDLKRMRSISARYGKELGAVGKNALMPPASKQQQVDSILAQKKGEQEALLRELETRKQ